MLKKNFKEFVIEYVYHFEGENGMISGSVTAKNIWAAQQELEGMFPDDLGADGFWTNPDGDDFPLRWGGKKQEQSC
jgi:hypothetical protein